MTRTSVMPVLPSEDEEQAMLDFLARTPDFFMRHAEVLESMPIRHSSGGAASLIERQVQVLRGNNERLNQRLEQLLDNARHNEARVKGINALAQSLICADTLNHVIDSVVTSLQTEFAVDTVQLALFKPPEQASNQHVLALPQEAAPTALQDFFRMGQVVCDALDSDVAACLFADQPQLQSAALVPLGRNDCLGLLALGSADAQRFTPDMGKLFLEMTANLATAALRYHGATAA